MPPRPFPYPFNVGVDICSVQRVKSLIQRRPGQAQPSPTSLPQLHPFVARVFSFREILLFNLRFKALLHEPHADHDPALVTSAARYLAGRFAAKEAVIKAVRSRRILLKDVLVASEGSQPYAIVLDRSPIMTHVQRLYLNQNYGFSLPISDETDRHVVSSPSTDLEGHPDVASGVEQCEGQVAKLSISHDGDYATAMCLADAQPDVTRRTLLVAGVMRRYQEASAELRMTNADVTRATEVLLQSEGVYFRDLKRAAKQRYKQRKSQKKKLRNVLALSKKSLSMLRYFNNKLYHMLDRTPSEDRPREPEGKTLEKEPIDLHVGPLTSKTNLSSRKAPKSEVRKEPGKVKKAQGSEASRKAVKGSQDLETERNPESRGKTSKVGEHKKDSGVWTELFDEGKEKIAPPQKRGSTAEGGEKDIPDWYRY